MTRIKMSDLYETGEFDLFDGEFEPGHPCTDCTIEKNCGPDCSAGKHCDVCNDHCLLYDMFVVEDGSEVCESCFRINALAEVEDVG